MGATASCGDWALNSLAPRCACLTAPPACSCKHFGEAPARCNGGCDVCRRHQAASQAAAAAAGGAAGAEDGAAAAAAGEPAGATEKDVTEAAKGAVQTLQVGGGGVDRGALPASECCRSAMDCPSIFCVPALYYLPSISPSEQAWPGTEKRATLIQLLDKWRGSKDSAVARAAKALSRDECEAVLQQLVSAAAGVVSALAACGLQQLASRLIQACCAAATCALLGQQRNIVHWCCRQAHSPRTILTCAAAAVHAAPGRAAGAAGRAAVGLWLHGGVLAHQLYALYLHLRACLARMPACPLARPPARRPGAQPCSDATAPLPMGPHASHASSHAGLLHQLLPGRLAARQPPAAGGPAQRSAGRGAAPAEALCSHVPAS